MNPKIIFKAHESALDQSVNFEYEPIGRNIGRFEARYVRREDDYFIAYLSSQSGCEMACRMCHLTATGQNKFVDATLEDFLSQSQRVFEHYAALKPAKLVHFNFMARGEPLANPILLEDNAILLKALADQARQHDLDSKFLISTILPKSIGSKRIEDIFTSVDPMLLPEIYYSIYSMSKDFRRRWLPKAHTAEHGLDLLKSWQDHTGKTPKIHFAFIEGQNDSEEDMHGIANAILTRGLRVNLNIVRYNPPYEAHSRETEESKIQHLTNILCDLIKPEKARIVSRVGLDVKASCGTFLS